MHCLLSRDLWRRRRMFNLSCRCVFSLDIQCICLIDSGTFSSGYASTECVAPPAGIPILANKYFNVIISGHYQPNAGASDYLTCPAGKILDYPRC